MIEVLRAVQAMISKIKITAISFRFFKAFALSGVTWESHILS